MLVNADPLLIGQALLNLILNATDAIEGGGSIVIQYERPLPGDGKQFNLIKSATTVRAFLHIFSIASSILFSRRKKAEPASGWRSSTALSRRTMGRSS